MLRQRIVDVECQMVLSLKVFPKSVVSTERRKVSFEDFQFYYSSPFNRTVCSFRISFPLLLIAFVRVYDDSKVGSKHYSKDVRKISKGGREEKHEGPNCRFRD